MVRYGTLEISDKYGLSTVYKLKHFVKNYNLKKACHLLKNFSFILVRLYDLF